MGCAREARWTRASRTEGKILIAVNAPQLVRALVPVNYICRFLCKHTVRNSNRGWGAVMFEVYNFCLHKRCSASDTALKFRVEI
jgi:hypothetical protein